MNNNPTFCKYCGRQLNPNSKFCPSCGKTAKGRKGLIAGISIMSVLLAAAVIVIIVLATKKDNNKISSDPYKEEYVVKPELQKLFGEDDDDIRSDYVYLEDGGTFISEREEGMQDDLVDDWIYMGIDDDEEEEARPEGYDPFNRDDSGNTYNTLFGNSSAFHSEPVDYMTIDAPENAFWKDTTINVTPVSEEKLEEYQSIFDAELDYKGTLLCGYDVDAGMEPDDIMPGEYTVTYDLAEAGVPQDMWEAVSAYRLDDDGYWQEYCTWLDGSKICLESSQNSVLFYVVSAYVGYVVIDELVPGISSVGWKRYFDIEDYIYVCEGGKRYTKKLFCVKFTYSATVQEMINRKNTIIADSRKKIKMPDAKRAVAADEGNMNPTDEELSKIVGPKLHAKVEFMLNQLLANNPDYVKLCEEIKQAEDNPNATVEMVKHIARLLLYTHDYMKDEIKVKLPNYVMDVKLSPTVASDAKGVTVSGILKKAYMYVNTSYLASNPTTAYDDLLLTLTHEYFHACQRRYKCSRLSNLKFDEATANMIEEDCREYYSNKGYLSHIPSVPNGNCWEMYALPLDDFSVTYPEVSKSFPKSDKSDTGYPLCHFVRYLMNKYNKSYADVLTSYGSFYGKPSFTEIMKEAFGLTDEALNTQYILFVRKNQAKFYEYAKQKWDASEGTLRWACPRNGFDTDDLSYRVDLNDHDYTTRVRLLHANTNSDYYGDISMLIVFDKGFSENLPDTKVFPVGNGKTDKCRFGLFYHPRSILDASDFWLLEVDGGSSDKSGSSGYTVYTMEAPLEMDSEVTEDGILRFKLPEKSETAEAGYIDGFRVTIKASDGTKTEKFYTLRGADHEIGIKVKALIGRDTDPDTATFDLTVCEFIRNGATGKLFGPESESRKSSLEAAMNETLTIMGATDGVITISLGWQSDDDLDLHVLTPEGHEIYYSNKVAGGGELDVDMQVEDDNLVANPAEHIVFKDPQEKGVYKVFVVDYTDRTEGYDTPFLVVVKVGDKQKSFTLTASSYSTSVVSFRYGEGDESGGEFETD